MFANKQIANHISRNKLKIVANSIWMSKARYGLQLTNKVRLTEDDSKTKNIKAT